MRFKLAQWSMCVMLAAVPFAPPAQASRGDTRSEVRSSAQQRNTSSQAQRQARPRGTSAGSSSGGLTCVPYARSVTGMAISGNGRDWWHNAAGRYARGQRPQTGSVLAWPGSGSMSSGHVAVVSRVLNGRMIEIDHANWGGPGIRRGTVMRNVKVMDVSDDNSWTRVRVQVGWTSENFGREYPTFGFIHNRPAHTGVAHTGLAHTGLAHTGPADTGLVNTGLAYASDDMIRPVSYRGGGSVGPRTTTAQRTRAARRSTAGQSVRTAQRSANRTRQASAPQPIRVAQARTTR